MCIAMAGGEPVKLQAGTLEVTPTWAVSAVCTIFVLVSFILERLLHHLGKWLSRNNQPALFKALQKMKEELMLVGFMSLLIAVFQQLIADICMPPKYLNHMLPCKLTEEQLKELKPSQSEANSTHNLRRNLAAAVESKCFSKGKVPFMSLEGIHQLHIFLFALAIVHVVYSCLTMVVGRWKLHAWKAWEATAHTLDYEPMKVMSRSLNLKRQSTFVRAHAQPKWSTGLSVWMVCFFHQFGRSVTESDYLTLRHGFLMKHNINKSFDFHAYMLRALEDDFKKVVGISAYMWVFVLLFLLSNVHGLFSYFWISFIPLLIILIIGTKLQHIIVTLAVEIAQQEETRMFNAAVKPRDELFWFSKPKLILTLIHFALFQNALELALFFWIWATFGFNSCFMESLGFVIVRLVIGVVVFILCSYTTLPLYALVTQMGSRYKAAIFGEDVKEALTGWREKAKKRASVHGGSTHKTVETEMQDAH